MRTFAEQKKAFAALSRIFPTWSQNVENSRTMQAFFYFYFKSALAIQKIPHSAFYIPSAFVFLAIGLQFIVKGLEADRQQVGCAGFIVVGLNQSLENQLSFRLVKRDRDRQCDFFFISEVAPVEHLRWEMLLFDALAFANDDGVLDDVAQFPDISRP
jgi:hypothetical protein